MFRNAVNQGLATLAFFGVNVNLVLFLTRVLQQSNAVAANNVSKWTGALNIFSLVGAFLSDSYWGGYKTCVVFQAVFVFVSDFCKPFDMSEKESTGIGGCLSSKSFSLFCYRG